MLIRMCVFLNFDNKDIFFVCVFNHIGIGGNEKADSAAKSALELPHAKVGVPYTNITCYQSVYSFHLSR